MLGTPAALVEAASLARARTTVHPMPVEYVQCPTQLQTRPSDMFPAPEPQPRNCPRRFIPAAMQRATIGAFLVSWACRALGLVLLAEVRTARRLQSPAGPFLRRDLLLFCSVLVPKVPRARQTIAVSLPSARSRVQPHSILGAV